MGGGGKGGSSSTTVSIPPEVIARYNAVNARAEETAKTPFQEYSQDPNAFVAPLNATQQAGVANTNAYAGAAQPYYKTAADYTTQGAAAANPTALDQNAINQYMSPYLNDVVSSTMANLRQQQGQEQSQFGGGLAARGAWGGDRAGIAAANLNKQQDMASSQIISGLLNQGYGQALQTAQQQQGVGLSAQQANLARLSQAGSQMGALGTAAQGAGLAGAQAQLAAGQIGQQTEQAGKSALYNQFLQKQGYPFQVTQFLANIAEGTGALSGSTTNTVQASDRRLKHDIKHIGQTNDGEPLYSFKYNGDDTVHFGPMAQNVEKRHPENVGLAGGYKTVDYTAVADRAAAHEHDQHAAHGGLIHSQGGGVFPEHAREGFATGGFGAVNPGVAAGFDQDFINDMLSKRNEAYSQMYGQPGGVRGATGTPGGKGVIPAPMGVSKPLQPAASPLQQRKSGAETAFNYGEKAAKVYGVGKEIKKDYQDYQKGKEEEAAKKAAEEKAAAEAAAKGNAGVQPVQKQVTENQPQEQRQQVVENKQEENGGKAFEQKDASLDVNQLPEDANTNFDVGDFGDVFAGKRGGRVPKKGGGGFHTPGYDEQDDPSNIMDDLAGAGNGSDYAAEFHGMQPKGGGSGGSGDNTLGTVASIAGTAAKFLPLLLSSGGVAAGQRQGYALQGGVDEKPALIDAVPVDDTEDTGLGRVRLAKDESTSSDATGVAPPKDENFERSVGRTLGFEGKLNPKDTNGTPSLYGINQKAHPEIDFSTLTPEKAKEIYRKDYWDSIGASKLEPKLAHVAFDTAVISGPAKARELIAASGGDPEKLLALREQFQNGLIERNPEKFGKYAPAWKNRLEGLRSDIGATSPEAAAPDRPTTSMALTSRNQLEAGDRRAAAVPGTAGMGRGATDEFSAPFLAMANKVAPDLPGFLKTENFWVPALGALAAGLSSRAPTKIQGIGEALAGGVGAYTGLRDQQARLAESGARTEKTYADIVKDNIFDVGGRGYFRYLKPDGGWGVMQMVDYFKLPPDQRQEVKFDPRIETVMPNLLKDYNEKYGLGTKKEEAAPPAAAAAGAPTVSSQPAGGTPPAATTGAPKTTTGAPAAPAQTAIAPDQTDLERARKDHEAIVQGGSTRANQEPDLYTPQKELADASQNVRPVLRQLAGGLSALPADKSILASGKPQEILNPLAQYMDGLLRTMGLPTGINPEDLANTQATMKAVAQFQDKAASESGRKAYASYAALAQTLPSILNTPRAQAKLLSSLYQANQIELDKHEFFDKIRQNADEYDPQTALKTGRSANQAFNAKYGSDFYQGEKKQIERMFGTTIQGMKDPQTGRDMTVLQVLTTDPGKLSREDKSDIVKQFGGDPRILRYFGITM